MQRAVKHTYYITLVVFACTACLTLAALTRTWFFPSTGTGELPYLGTLVGSLLVEAIAIVFAFLRTGFKYLPDVVTNKTESETFAFMIRFIRRGTTVTIVSNRLSLLTRSPEFLREMAQAADKGTRFEIITPRAVAANVRDPLQIKGVQFIVTGEANAPEARFTLVNGDRAGGEQLAIARGTHPEHEITIFDSNSGPQMIALARDIIRKSKLLAHA